MGSNGSSPIEEALRDPAFSLPDTYVGPAGITWLHRWAMTRGVPKSAFAGEPEPGAFLPELRERDRMSPVKRAFRIAASAIGLLGAFSSARADTVLVLVRHGEKVDESRDADLNAAGRARAEALAAMLKDAGIEAVYTTDYIRTRETARPMAELISKPIEVYDGDKLEAFARDLRARGARALVVGHSDTTPELVQLLGGVRGSPIAPDEYDRMYVLTLSADGKTSTTLLRFHTGVSQ